MTEVTEVGGEPDPRRLPEAVWFAHYLARIHIDAEASAGAFSLTEMEADPFDGPWHVHSRESETFFVLEGRLTVQTREVTAELGPGDSFLTPLGTPHRYGVVAGRARWLMISSPAGFEDLIRAAGSPALAPTLPPPGAVPDAAANEHVSSSFGVTYL